MRPEHTGNRTGKHLKRWGAKLHEATTDVPAILSHLRSGFTLIEMLVVMAIVALLLTVALPRYFGSIDKAKEVALKENLQVIRAGIDKYYADKGRYPEALDDLVTQKYLRSVPVDPITELATTWILIPSTDADRSGVENVKSGAQGKTRGGLSYEQL
jgi:general secretion pathway protein G